MELLLVRKIFTEKSTIGELYINGGFFSFVLEDRDRGLTSNMSEADISRIKVKNETCIPCGNYEIVNDFSPHFNKYMPHILSVPGFDGIRIHGGNKPEDTEGCLLLGYKQDSDFIEFSKPAVDNFLKYYFLPVINKNEQVFISITK